VSLISAVDQLDASNLSRKSDMALIWLLTCCILLHTHYSIKIACLQHFFVGQNRCNLNITFIKYSCLNINLYLCSKDLHAVWVQTRTRNTPHLRYSRRQYIKMNPEVPRYNTEMLTNRPPLPVVEIIFSTIFKHRRIQLFEKSNYDKNYIKKARVFFFIVPIHALHHTLKH
jgi:hypothetical protein